MAGPCGCPQGIGTPEEVMEIVCAHVDTSRGLACDPQQMIGARLGSGLVFDPQGRIAAAGGAPPPSPCEVTVDTLPEFTVGGDHGGSGLTHAYGSPQAIDYAIDSRLDTITGRCFGLVGPDVAAWLPANTADATTSFYTTNVSDASMWGTAHNEWGQFWSDAGTAANPVGRNNTNAPASERDPDGGWYGWYAPQYPLMTAETALRRIAGRAVAILRVPDENPFGGWGKDIRSCINAVNGACAQANSIIEFQSAAGLEWITTIQDAGITAMINTADGGITGAQVAAAGGQWLKLGIAASDARISEAVGAGLNVVIQTDSRHADTSRCMDLGCRGVVCDDPVYAAYPIDPATRGAYRRNTNSYSRRTAYIGHLTDRTDDGENLAGRGYSQQNEAGLFVRTTDTNPDRWETFLMGNLLPVADPSSYEITWQCQVDEPDIPGPSIPAMGVAFAQVTDRDISTDGQEGRTGYYAHVQVNNGTLIIGRYNPDGTRTQLATQDGPDLSPNAWMNMELLFSGGQITFRRTSVNPVQEVTATDTTYQGPYVFWTVRGATNVWAAGLRNLAIPDAAAVTPLPGPVVPDPDGAPPGGPEWATGGDPVENA